VPDGKLKGVKMTRLGTRLYADTLVRKVDPRGKDYYWIGGEDPVWQPEEGSDFHTVDQGFVSVTPMRLELTDQQALADMQGWGLAL
jgi:5'-nucleotidase